ncbi:MULTISPECIES: hypothetical protein [Listeria]|uniref:Uncharacterized protein n=1 Tax=Listeria immobilis TaxID=2713502 RepID=A0ABR6SWB4_9LIST|nr:MULTISPECIES: hypothetical protein [Listeria]AIS61704.1 hypothetical protein JL53_02740 [Listeria ivanovii subsp. londoniensis]MBC1482564.1 hypothetical protein [Listeria immobilis]MBC1509826.1 hypothetical protein [Listeria immobilis]MBK1965854.1 hypothetical protein [Listeria ivanovii subsp. londoniensis]MBK1984799.1 hypothetical protein [Listeria ivanovii subsp. londoniensis]
MYQSTYQRGMEMATGSRSGELLYQAKQLRERLDKGDLSDKERSNLVMAERELIQQAQKIDLKKAVKKGATKIEDVLDEEMDRVQKNYPTVQEDLQAVQVTLKDAFESATGDAVFTWLQTTRTEAIQASREALEASW